MAVQCRPLGCGSRAVIRGLGGADLRRAQPLLRRQFAT